ncbi:MAG: hypothetical protein ABFS42_15085 [Candidatus Krumholzibacteriota bacterium]
MKTVTATLILVLSFCALNSAWAQRSRSPEVEKHMIEANFAGEWLNEENLAEMEKALEPGFHSLAIMLGNYSPDQKTNHYLRERGWGQLVWTQLMYRLLAIQNGVFDQELEFAERVALESVARSSLETVETSFARIQTLLEAKEKMGLDKEIDQFAQGFFPDMDGAGAYQKIISGFRDRFHGRRDAVIARLESQEHPGIVDPSEFPSGTRYAKIYREHQKRLEGENRLDEILNRLVQVDSHKLRKLVETAQNAPSAAEREAAKNEVKLQLILVEDSLDASENDSSLARLIECFDRWGHTAFEPYGTYPDDFQGAMFLIYEAQRNLAEQSRPENLRDLYSFADLVQ